MLYSTQTIAIIALVLSGISLVGVVYLVLKDRKNKKIVAALKKK